MDTRSVKYEGGYESGRVVIDWVCDHGGQACWLDDVSPGQLAIKTVDGWRGVTPGTWVTKKPDNGFRLGEGDRA